MIAPMKKITVICLASDRDATLSDLRDLGVLHVIASGDTENPGLAALKTRSDRATQALASLSALQPPGDPADAAAPPDPGRAEGIVNKVGESNLRLKELGDRILALERKRAAIAPFGNFDPRTVRELAGKGIVVKLCHAASTKQVAAPKDVECFPIVRTKTGFHFVLVGRGEFEIPGTEIPLPEESLGEIEASIAAARAEVASVGEALRGLARFRGDISALLASLGEQMEYRKTADSMGTAGQVLHVTGFCPANLVERLRDGARIRGWGLFVRDPSDDDKVPVLLRNPAWLKPVETIFNFIRILPGYREVDVSASFLLFLSVFFAMIIGDAGYGIVILLITQYARSRMRNAPPGPFFLLRIFGVCTIAWGIMTGSYFGMTAVPGPLAALRVNWLGSDLNIMRLCLLIGAIHLTIAHVWNLSRMLNSALALAQAGWICMTWTMFFTAKSMLEGKQINELLPGWFVPVPLVGLALIALFMTPRRRLKTDWANHMMLPLSIASNFGDVLSYMRLFALGMASLKLAEAFNTMAMSLGFGGVLSGMFAALLLFAGHSLNIALSMLSVLVHGIRLNALEFSTHLGLEWAGFPYAPFARRPGLSNGSR